MIGSTTTLQNAEIGIQAGGIAASAAGAAALSTGAIAMGTMAAAAIPFIGPIVAAIGIFVGMAFKPDLRKVATTQIVNQAEVLLKKNLVAWQQLVNSGQANADAKNIAEQNFNQVWQAVVQNCGAGSYGTPGVNCVKDRDRGGKWDWFALYYDPIANYQIPTIGGGSISSSIASIAGGLGVGGGGLLLLGGGLLIAMLVMGDGK